MVNKLSGKVFQILALLWVLAWALPWTAWLQSMPWIRLGFSLVIFTIPGMTISLLLMDKRLSLASHFTSGLVFSVLLVGMLGLIGRVVRAPFAFIKPIFFLAGLVGLLMLVKQSLPVPEMFKKRSYPVATIVLLAGMVIFGITVAFQNRINSDDLKYLAHLTNWQHAQPLNFKEVYFGSETSDSIRFWIAMFPMNLAFLAQISDIPGLLLIGFYLEPFLVPIAILALYDLYENLLQSVVLTTAALLLQFTFLFLLQADQQQPGYAFFNRLSEDKAFAAFILAPILFLAIICLLETYTPRTAIFAFLCGLSMTLMHPVILAYSIFIAAVYTGIVVITGRSYKKLYIVGLLAITVLPAAVLRFIDVPSASRYAFDLESALKTHYVEDRISNIEGTPFYGFNLERVKIPTNQSDQLSPLQFILSWAYLWLCGLGLLWSVLNLRKTAAPFIAATSLLLLLSAVPYTGWILGYFVTARMLWRTPWLLPIGLIGAKLLAELLGAVVPKLSWIKWTRITVERTTLSVIVLISISLTGYFSIYTYREIWKALAQLKSYRNSLENLSQLGDYLENNIKQPSIIEGGDYLDLYLAGLSSKSKVVSFGNESSPLYPVDKEELNLVAIQDKSISIEQRIDIMEKYHIQYVLVDKRWLAEYYTKNPHFRSKRIGDLWLLVFRKIDE